MNHYAWKRFLCRPDGIVDLSDNGFLTDPEDDGFKYIKTDILPFEQISDKPCIVLLGEPGIGKSDVLFSEFNRLIPVKEQKAFFDLGEYGTGDELKKSVFQSDKMQLWKNGNFTLNLFLDGLDECRAKIDYISRLMVSQFKEFGQEKLKLLKIRLACRTYDWPRYLNAEIPKLWGEQGCGIYEVVPLRKIDVKEAVRQNGIDAETFIQNLIKLEIVPFAIKPITLKFLIDTHKTRNELPNSKNELYNVGCQILCTENNPAWQDIIHGRNIMTAPKKFECAMQIAAVSMLCKKTAISLRSIDTIGESEITPDAIRGQIQVCSENEIKETLGTGLFSSRGTERFGFAHLSYAEYLAACFINKSTLTKPQIESLLLQSVGGIKMVIPQLQEVAAWLASMHEGTFKSISENDPQVLLQGDLSNKKDAEKELLVKSLLDLLQLQKINNRKWGLCWTYHKLKHANIEKQLDAYIRGKQYNLATRHEALLIARECTCAGLQDLLVEISLDTTEDNYIRETALLVLEEIGSKDAKAKILPLLDDEAANDQKLIGRVLSVLWPYNMDAEKLVSILKLPKKEFGGNSYTSFISGDLIKGITRENVAIVLDWLEHNPTTNFYVRRFTDEIIAYAWKYTEDEVICRSLTKLIISLIRTHYRIISEPEVVDKNPQLFGDANARHRLVNCIINELQDDRVATYITFYNPKLLRSDDLPWLLSNLTSVTDEQLRHSWAVLTRYIYDPQNIEHYDLLVECSKKFPVLAKECGMEPIELGSETAEKLKKYYLEMTELSEHRSRPAKEEETLISAEEQIAYWLEESKKGNPDSWLGLCFFIAANEERACTVIDITSENAWQELNENDRSLVGRAALQFLEQQTCDTAIWTSKSGWNAHDLAPNKAFYLLKTIFPDKFASLDISIWKKWISSLVGCVDVPEMREINAELAEVAYKKCPNEFLDALKLRIGAQLQQHMHYVDVHKRLLTFWDDKISALILTTIKQNELSGNVLRDLLGELLARKYMPALTYAKELVSSWTETNEQTIRIFDAAIILLSKTEGADWDFIFSMMQKSQEFGKQLMLEYADHRYSTNDGGLTTKLSETQIGDLLIWLSHNFPHEEDPKHEGAYSPSKRDKVAELRDILLNYLTSLGTVDALHALEKIACVFPKYAWLKSTLVDARKNIVEKIWQAPKPEHLHKLLLRGETRYVTSGHELLETVIEKLEELETQIHSEYGVVELLWDNRGDANSPKRCPKEERSLSDFITFWFKHNVAGKHILVNRETEIRRGQKTDIHIDAICNDGSSNAKLSLIIETKGCWNKELLTAMQSQLVDMYLKNNEWPYGIYLVGWFLCDKWDKDDYRRNDTSIKDLKTLKTSLNEQAIQIMTATSTVHIRAQVMNLMLP